VNLTDASDEWVRIGLSGPDSAKLLNNQLSAVPEKIDADVQENGLIVMRIPGPQARFELHGPVEEIQSIWQTFSESVQVVGAGPWALLDIHAGIPVIYTATQEAFVPQMVNLQAINGVSFNKGCYTGQEVVARMQYLGKLKRRMYLAHVETSTCPNPGDELYSSYGGSGQGTGKVVTAQPSAKGGYDLLAVIQVAIPEANEPVQLLNAEGPELSLRELPYSLEADL
ncbi:MAG: folate-binding protein YgfZ, partial [Gammaproteobacteria bacterium]|nr:folate-binding protein YgfZ [Gammaproteobacteria bacterium]